MFSLLNQLIWREISIPLLFSMLTLTALLLLGRLIPLLEPLLGSGISLGEFGKLVILIVPTLLLVIVPVSCMMGVLLAFMRLARDGEMLALFACGVGPRQMVMPVGVICLVAWGISLVTSTTWLPESKARSKVFIAEVMQKALARGIPEQVFLTPVKGLTIYCNKTSHGGRRLKGVYIKDSRRKELSYQILARRGDIVADPKGRQVVLKLKDGTLTRVGDDFTRIDLLGFDSYILRLDLDLHEPGRGRGEMGLGELLKEARAPGNSNSRTWRYLTEFHKRLAIPVGTFVLGMLAAPLGIFFGRAGLSGGVALGLGTFLAYYLLIIFGGNLAESGVVPASGLWFSNLLFGILAIWLWRLLSRKGPILG